MLPFFVFAAPLVFGPPVLVPNPVGESTKSGGEKILIKVNRYIMAHEPKLEIFKFHLKRKEDGSNVTFRELMRHKSLAMTRTVCPFVEGS